MVTCTWETRTAGEVALVAGCCRAGGRVDRAVTLEPAGPGPVRPPPRDPAGAGWTGGRVVWTDGKANLRVPVGGTVPVGFATTVPVPDPPVTIVRDEPAADDRSRDRTTARREPSPDAIARTLPTPAPPADAVPDTLDHRPPAHVREWLDDAERRLSGDDAPPDLRVLEGQLSTVAERAGFLANRTGSLATQVGALTNRADGRERGHNPTDGRPT